MDTVLIPNPAEAYSIVHAEPSLSPYILEQEVTELSLRIIQKTLEAGQDHSAGALRRLIQQLTEFQQTQRAILARIEPLQTDTLSSLWHQLRELEVLLRAYEHHVKLVQERFQLRASGALLAIA